MKQVLLRNIPRLAGILLLYAAISKLYYPTQATAALEALGLSYARADAVIFAVIAVELYLGLILMLHLDLKWSLSAAMGLMFLFTIFLWYLSRMSKPPSCGCLGLTAVFNSSKQEAIFGLVRNCVILWALKLSYDYHFKPAAPASPGGSEGMAGSLSGVSS